MLISAVNVSEGRRLGEVASIADAAGRYCHLVDVHSDPDHNRSIITLAGRSGPLIDAIVAATRRAMELVHLGSHSGVHPRLGVIDVVPFVSDQDLSEPGAIPQEAIETSTSCARRIWTELAIPCFLYEFSSAKDGDRQTLPAVRRDAFAKLQPDFGGPAPHPTAGAVTLGARHWLVAYNLNLDEAPLSVARQIAAGLRSRFRYVRALGLALPSRGLVQVSCNLIRPATTTMTEVFEAASEMAQSQSVQILECEVAGLATRESFGRKNASSLRFPCQPKVVEDCLEWIADSRG